MRLGIAVLFSLLAVGCGGAGATTRVHANASRYPVSFSGGVPEAGGKVLLADRDLEVTGKLSESHWRFSTFYGFAPSESTVDLSGDINREVAQQGGEAVVRLRVNSNECFLNYVFPLVLLPFWPGCVIVDVEGDVVRRRNNTVQQ